MSGLSAIIASMILVTGGTGFIGSRMVRKLVQMDDPVRILLRPNRKTPRLPKNVALNIAVSSIADERGLLTALRGVDTVLHFATAEHQDDASALEHVDVDGSACLVDMAKEAHVKRIIYLGRIGADKSSSYPVLRAKALAEEIIRKSGIPFCILRLTDVFGPRDHFTTEIAAALQRAPMVFPLPGDGRTLVQPIWVDDLISIITLVLEQKSCNDEVIEIGGGEFFTIRQVVQMVMDTIARRKTLFSVSPAYLRLINLWFRRPQSLFPLSTQWLDLLAMDRTCPLDAMTRNFSILPARFVNHLGFLKR